MSSSHFPRRGSNPFKVDWTDKNAVVDYAKRLGKGQTVFKHPSRRNYNITHTVRTDQYEQEWVVYQT